MYKAFLNFFMFKNNNVKCKLKEGEEAFFLYKW